jgi:pilus assembly protein Flp/PilA
MFRYAMRVKAVGRDRRGATMIEYALVIVVVALVAVVGLKAIGTNLNTQFGSISTAVADPNAAPSQ